MLELCARNFEETLMTCIKDISAFQDFSKVLTVYFCSVEHFQQFKCVISCCLTLSEE